MRRPWKTWNSATAKFIATLLRAGIPLLEGLRLEEADKGNYMLSALPIRLTGENGAPCRAVLVEEN